MNWQTSIQFGYTWRTKQYGKNVKRCPDDTDIRACLLSAGQCAALRTACLVVICFVGAFLATRTLLPYQLLRQIGYCDIIHGFSTNRLRYWCMSDACMKTYETGNNSTCKPRSTGMQKVCNEMCLDTGYVWNHKSF